MQKNIVKKGLVIAVTVLFIAIVLTPIGFGDKLDFSNVVNNSIKVFFKESGCFGFCVYDPSGQIEPGPLWFESDDPGNLTHISNDSHIIYGGSRIEDGSWFACDCDGAIWIVDFDHMILIGDNDVVLNGLAYDAIRGIMYGASDDELFEVNLDNGSLSLVGSFDIPGESMIIGLACDFYRLYGIGLDSDSLYDIDKETGKATFIGALGIDLTNQSDLEYDFDNYILYLSSFNTQGEFYSVDIFYGGCSLVLVGVFQGGAHITGLAIPFNLWDEVPGTPVIYGPSSGKVGVSYEYTFWSTAPSGPDKLTYCIDWGDNNSEWTDYMFYEAKVNHTWGEKGTYVIKAKAKDELGFESPWSDFKVTMPRNRAIIGSLFLRFLEHLHFLKNLKFKG